MERVKRWSPTVVWSALLISFALTAHVFFRLVDYAPYYAVDDSLASISTYISNTGHYGMPAAPLEFSGKTLRLDKMLNYGPLTFYFGALLDWTFGTSYALFRSVHLMSIFAVIVMAVVTFPRIAIGLATVLGAVLLHIFWSVEWPMFRPDPVTAALAVSSIAASTWALRRGTLVRWFLVGFLAASAAGNHQIVWSIVPATIIIWLVSLAMPLPDGSGFVRTHLRTLIVFGSGGLLGGTVYLAGTGFRIGDLIGLWAEYARLTARLARPSDLTFHAIISKQFEVAWSGMPPTEIAVLYVLCALAGVISFVAIARVIAARHVSITARQLIATTFPPFIGCLAYSLSLGTYTNYHTGYVILVHYLTAWSACAAIAGLLIVLHSPRSQSRFAALAQLATAITGAAVLLVASAVPLNGTRWDTQKLAQVSFPEYANNVLDGISPRDKIIGDVIFGLDAGSGHNMLYIHDGLYLLDFVKPDQRDRFSPDYLILNRYLDDLAYSVLEGESLKPVRWAAISLLSRMPDWKSNYAVAKIVDAPPYGATYVYRKSSKQRTSSSLPVVAAYIPEDKRWLRQIGDPLPATTESSSPLSLKLTNGINGFSITASATVSVKLPPGVYLATVRVEAKSSKEAAEHPCFVTATKSLAVSARSGDMGFGVQLVPCLGGELSIPLIVRHGGGQIFFSGIGDIAGFALDSIRPLLADDEADDSPLPPLRSWVVTAKGGSLGPDGAVVGDTSKFGYQITSPMIPVRDNSVGQIKVVLEPEQGTFGVGVLSEDGSRWLAPPVVMGVGTVRFDTGRAHAVRIVIANANQSELSQPAKFHFAGGNISFEQRGGDAYVRSLAACFKDFLPNPPDYCNTK